MTTRITRRFLAAVTLLAIGSATPAGSERTLRLRLDKGDTHRFALTHLQSLDIDSAGARQKLENTSRIEFAQTVVDKRADGSLVLDTIFERMRSEMAIGGMKLTFDTDDDQPSQHPMARMQQLMTGKHFVVTQTPRGQVETIEGFEAIFQGIAAAFADDPTLARTLDVMKQSFGEEAMKSMMQQGVAVYPEGAVDVGDTWQQQVVLPNPALGQLKVTTDYSVEATERLKGRDCTKIALSSTIEFSHGGQMFGQLTRLLGAEMKVDISSASGDGALWVDTASGQVVSSQVEQQIVMDLSLEVPEGEAAGRAMDMHGTITQQFGVELLD